MVAAATWSLITIRWKSLSESNQEAREHRNDTMQRDIRDCCRSSNEIALNSSGCGHFWSGSVGLGFQKGNLRSRFPVISFRSSLPTRSPFRVHLGCGFGVADQTKSLAQKRK